MESPENKENNKIKEIKEKREISSSSSISLVKVILFFYILAASGFLKDLFSGQLQDFLKTRTGMHLLGITTMFIIILEHDYSMKLETIILYTLIGYSLFIFTTKV